jgi:hypothetical protein
VRFFRNVLTRTTIARYLFMVAAFVLVSGYAMAGVIATYSGQDDGAAITGPFPNSTAAQALFFAAASALSQSNTITFEGLPLGYSTSFTAAPGVNVSVSATDFGPGYSGISNTTNGYVTGFNTTPGGAEWFGFPAGSATFSFARPTEYFGFWLTGLQTIFTSSLTVQFNDGAAQSLSVPIDLTGGAQFFGFTDPGAAITSVTITNTSADAWGIDDVSYDNAPEPSSLLLLGSGALGLVALIRRKRTQ